MADTLASSSAPALTFTFSAQQLRAVLIDGEPWFVAADACAALDVQNVTQAVARLDDDERAMFNIGRQGEATVINESGLYSLILTSRKPEAKRFKKWVTSEVLPAIRKTGRYEAPAAPPAAYEALNAGDHNNIARLVWLISRWFRFEQSMVQAVWFAIRQSTGVPAPQRFGVRHLPAIVLELRRCYAIANAFQEAQRKAEEMVIKRIVRKREAAEPILAQAAALMLEGAQKDEAKARELLNRWDEQDLLAVTNRGQCYSDHSGYGEPQLTQAA